MTCEDCKAEPAMYQSVCADCQRTRTRLALEELIRTADSIILHAESTKQAALNLQWQIMVDSETPRAKN